MKPDRGKRFDDPQPPNQPNWGCIATIILLVAFWMGVYAWLN